MGEKGGNVIFCSREEKKKRLINENTRAQIRYFIYYKPYIICIHLKKKLYGQYNQAFAALVPKFLERIFS